MRPRIPERKIQKIKELRAKGHTVGDTAKLCGVSHSTIHNYTKQRINGGLPEASKAVENEPEKIMGYNRSLLIGLAITFINFLVVFAALITFLSLVYMGASHVTL